MWTIRRPTPACWRGAAHEAHRETRGEVAVYRAGRAVGGRYRRALLERQPVRPAYPGGARKSAGAQGRVGRHPLQPAGAERRMKRTVKHAAKWLCIVLAVLLAAGIAACFT